MASGHTLRHTPTATTNKKGAMGINIFQNNNTPIGGKNNKQVKMVAPISQTRICTMRQIKIELGDNSAPDLKGRVDI